MAKQLIVEVLGDNKQFSRTLNEATTHSTRFGNILQGIGQGIGQGLMGLVTQGIQFVTSSIIGSIDAASKLEQSVGAVNSVFGDSSHIIADFGKTSADSFGISQRAANEMAAVVGAQLQSMGFDSKEAAERVVTLEQRGADLAATFGGTTSDAIEAISSLLRGERDPIEKYGVSIKQVDVNARIAALGLNTNTAAAKKNAEAIAAMDLLMEQSAKSAGQFGREADTLAGQQARLAARFEDAQAALGQKLMPAVVEIIGWVNDSLIPAIEDAIVVFGNIADAADDLGGVFDTLSGHNKEAADSADLLGSKTSPLGQILHMVADEASHLLDTTGPYPGAWRDIAKAVGDGSTTIAEGARGLGVASASLATEIPAALEDARLDVITISRKIPGDIADAIWDRRNDFDTQWEQFLEHLDEEMSPLERQAYLRGILTSEELARGLASKDPAVRYEAQQIRINTLNDLAGETEDPRRIGRNVGQNYATGIQEKKSVANQAARVVVGGAATWFIQAAKDSKRYGANTTSNFASGLNSKAYEVANSAKNLANLVSKYLKPSSPTELGPMSKVGGPEGFGERVGKLFSKGLANAVPNLNTALGGSLNASLVAGSARGGGSVVVEIGTFIGSGEDIDRLANLIAERIRLAGV